MLKKPIHKIEELVPLDRLYSLRVLKTPRSGKVVARWLVLLCTIFFIVLFLPWQQNIRGRGVVTALSPGNRPQTVESAIPGRIQKWHVREGQFVNKGDTILSLSEIKDKYFDPLMLSRLAQQIVAKERSLDSKYQKAQSLKSQINALRLQQKIKLEQARAKLEAEKVKFDNASNQYERNKKLYDAGNIPLTKLQDFEYKFQGSKADFSNATIEVGRVEAEFVDKINKAESELNNTLAELYDTQGSLVKTQNEYSNVEIRNEQYRVIAPQAGIIVKALKAGVGETIKEGEAVCTIMPEVSDLAVAMYIKAMDVPLLSKGRKTRIQFDGWPALQFSGWPNVSVGTFGGKVEVIDLVNSKPGEFRILVIPDESDEPWPTQLRIGSGTKGWVMLNDVPVWYEIWRQFNGFPASIYEQPEDPMKEGKNEDANSNLKPADEN